MIRKAIHENICNQSGEIANWFCEKTKNLKYPIYSSYDIRDAGFKISNVDANIYPAGFNNICPTDRETSIALMERYISSHYGNATNKILLVTEEHTNNPYYWENVLAIRTILEGAGKRVMVGIPKRLTEPFKVQSASGQEVHVTSAYEDSEAVKEFKPDLIISNNDFSNSHEDWAAHHTLPMNPPRELGWYQRKKSRYFKNYNQLVSEFAEVAKFDPFLLNVETEVFEHFDLADDSSRDQLAKKADDMIARLEVQYKSRGIDQKPFLFVKNNSGTYGLAVIRVGSGEEIRAWNYKSRKKMKAAKGGADVEEVIIQEGIPTHVKSDGNSAEPVIYMIGCELAGGFLRTHGEKSDTDSLNSPGAVFKKLCVSDLNVSLQGSPLENVYGWSARLGLMAIALEAEQMGVQFKGFKSSTCV